MDTYDYLIIGGGMTADAAAKGIREVDPTGSIGMVSLESDPPYKRPLLSKGLWKGKPLESVWRHTEQANVEQVLGRRIVSLDPDTLLARDDQGREYQAGKVLLATGGRPRRLPFGGDDIIYFRTLQDYHKLADLAASRQDFAVIGGGFIGAEIAAALAMNGKKTTMIFPEDGIGARVYPPDISQFLNNYYREKGVVLLTGEQVAGIDSSDGHLVVKTNSGHNVEAAAIIAGIGIEPNLELARAMGLTISNGVQVNEYLQTNRPNIYAAGDVAEFHNPSLDKRLRLEHEDTAVSMGRQAGRNMAGANEPYTYLPYFYSDLFDIGYEAIGELNSSLKTAADWAKPYEKGVIYYFKNDRIVGVLLWNVWDKVPAARELLAKPGPFKPGDLEAKKSPAWRIDY